MDKTNNFRRMWLSDEVNWTFVHPDALWEAVESYVTAEAVCQSTDQVEGYEWEERVAFTQERDRARNRVRALLGLEAE